MNALVNSMSALTHEEVTESNISALNQAFKQKLPPTKVQSSIAKHRKWMGRKEDNDKLLKKVIHQSLKEKTETDNGAGVFPSAPPPSPTKYSSDLLD